MIISIDTSIPVAFIWLFVSAFVLWWAGGKSVRYANQFAYRFGISTFSVGLILVACTTGLPDLFVLISALIQGEPSVSVGALISSNFTDICLILGILSVFAGVVKAPPVQRWSLVAILAGVGALMGLIYFLDKIQPWQGVVLIVIYFISMSRIWRARFIKDFTRKQAEETKDELKQESYLVTTLGSLVKLLVSFAFLIYVSRVSLQSLLLIVRSYEIPSYILGATVVSFGTSLPSLVMSMHAMRKQYYSLVLGDTFGSILEQSTLLLGVLVTGLYSPLSVKKVHHMIPFIIAGYALVGIAIGYFGKISRWFGVLLLLLYTSFIAFELLPLIR